jgi:hypothetical protein
MDTTQGLVKTSQLDFSLIDGSAMLQGGFFRYDPDFDALMILAVSPDTETVVHYIDDHVGLLYDPDTLRVVGIQVEGFRRSFLPKHAAVQRAWRLTQPCEKIRDFGDLNMVYESQKPAIANEILGVTREMLQAA